MTTQLEENLTDRDFKLVSDLVYRHCGINLHGGKRDVVRARLAKQARTANADSISEYLEIVRADTSGREFAGMIDAISTNLTSFFRESSHFDFLRDKFLPALIGRRKAKGARRLRAWSAGCSTGEEPYSLAMTLHEAIAATGGDASGWDVKVLATDISRPVLQRARAGEYAATRLDGIPKALRGKYFAPSRGGDSSVATVGDALRRTIAFNYLNLMEKWPFKGKFDFIFCRNVMIYFDKPTQERLVNRFWEFLEPGGMLFTGHSESLTGVSHKLKFVLPTVYSK